MRVYADAAAASSAAALDAQAYTIGSNIVFGAGRYEPRTARGRQLIAHELAHVVQQRSSDLVSPSIAMPDHGSEREAMRSSVATDGGVVSLSRQPLAIARQAADAPLAADTPVAGDVDVDQASGDAIAELKREGKPELAAIVSTAPPRLPPFLIPRFLPAKAGAGPFQLVFGPLDPKLAASVLEQTQIKPRAEREKEFQHGRELYLVYENDGSGIVPNFGAGSDQARTAAFYALVRLNPLGEGLTEAGFNFEMHTPRGLSPTTPSGAAPLADAQYLGTYKTATAGPFAGNVFGHVRYRLDGSGTSRTELYAAAGVNSRALGKRIQDAIHTNVSNSPLFPWPTGLFPFAEAGAARRRTIGDVMRGRLQNNLAWTGRLELSAEAVTGTRRTEGALRATLVAETAIWQTEFGEIHLDFTLGGVARGFIRYNDGRTQPLAGVEAGLNTSVMVSIGRIGLGLQGEEIFSTDPVFQTGLPAGNAPLLFEQEHITFPGGGFGTGQVFLRIQF